jgi:hypothetical protein
MKTFKIIILTLAGLAVSTPAYAASWAALEKGKCDIVSGKRIYKAKLKRSFGDDPSAELCMRLRKTVNGKSRVPDQCVKRGLNGHSGIWLEPDPSCGKADAKAKAKGKPQKGGS